LHGRVDHKLSVVWLNWCVAFTSGDLECEIEIASPPAKILS